MTWEELKDKIDEMGENQKNSNIVVFDEIRDEYHNINDIKVFDSCCNSKLDTGQSFLMF